MSKSNPKPASGAPRPTAGKDTLLKILAPGGYTPADGGGKKK